MERVAVKQDSESVTGTRRARDGKRGSQIESSPRIEYTTTSEGVSRLGGVVVGEKERMSGRERQSREKLSKIWRSVGIQVCDADVSFRSQSLPRRLFLSWYSLSPFLSQKAIDLFS